MTFQEWQQLSPAAAAREIHERVALRVSPSQRSAMLVWLAPESELAAAFAAAPRRSPLGAVPFVVKDLFDVADVPTRAGSAFLERIRPTPRSHGAFVRDLLAAGGVVAGKTQMYEMAYGLTGENPHFGDCEHPRFTGRTSGGSSSGSAAAVAAGIVPWALGSDTGGSIRVPAAFCGIFGFRLTPHHPWIADAFPLAPSFDTPGWFTASAVDMLSSLSALIGLGTSSRSVRGCYIEPAGLDSEIASACRTAAARLEVIEAEDVSRQWRDAMADAVDGYAVLQSTEAFSVHRAWLDVHRDAYSPEVWSRLDRGRRWNNEQLESAHLALTKARLFWTTLFLSYDYLVMPATPFPALKKADCTLENRQRLLALTAPASLGGLPVLTVPVALPSGLSGGLQVIVNNVQSPVIRAVLETWRE